MNAAQVRNALAQLVKQHQIECGDRCSLCREYVEQCQCKNDMLNELRAERLAALKAQVESARAEIEATLKARLEAADAARRPKPPGFRKFR